MPPLPATLAQGACAVLREADPLQKARLGQRLAAARAAGELAQIGHATPPRRPARPPRPVLKAPRDMPPRPIGREPGGRIALLHALAHIELNAIDLAWDIVARFTSQAMPSAFHDDWVRVADDEARHFQLLCERLAQLGAAYGDLPAHDGLWQAAQATAHDLLARLAVVPLVLEARGLDVTPGMIARLDNAMDRPSADILRIVHADEIAHVRAGKRWFDWLCARRGLDPAAAWKALVRAHFKGRIKPPFNDDARRRAGLAPDFYRALATEAGIERV